MRNVSGKNASATSAYTELSLCNTGSYLLGLFCVRNIHSCCRSFSLLPEVDGTRTGAPKMVTDRLLLLVCYPALNKYDRGLSRLLHSELHWLDVPERVQYKLGVVMYSCLHGQSPRYLADLCVPVSDVSARQHPSLWNSLPDSLRDPDLGRDSFRRLLKTHLFSLY